MKNCPKCGCDLKKEQMLKEAREKLAQLAEVIGFCSGGAWTQDMVVDAMADHADVLVPALEEIQQAKAE
jgi:hypothetical protein